MSKARTTYPYGVKQITDGIYLIDEKYSTMFLVEGENRALVIDCGVGAADFKGLVESLTPLPYDLVATHGHIDHIGGRCQFEKMYISEKDEKIVKEANAFQRWGLMTFNNLAGIGAPRRARSLCPIDKEPETVIVREGDVFDLGGRILEVIETPGHTEGSICLLLRNEKILFAGDVVNPVLFMWLSHATSLEELNETLDKLLALDCYDTVLQCHCNEPTGREAVEINKRLVLEILEKRTSLIPPIAVHKDRAGSGYRVIYRTSNIRSTRQ